MSENERGPAQTGWESMGRCPVDANVVHVAASFASPVRVEGFVDPVRYERAQPLAALTGPLVTPAWFDLSQQVDVDHGCGVPATRVGPGEAPLERDER